MFIHGPVRSSELRERQDADLSPDVRVPMEVACQKGADDAVRNVASASKPFKSPRNKGLAKSSRKLDQRALCRIARGPAAESERQDPPLLYHDAAAAATYTPPPHAPHPLSPAPPDRATGS